RQLERQPREPEGLRDRVREAALLEPVLDVGKARLLRGFAQQLLEPPRVGLEERAGEGRELGARLLQALLQLVEEALEVLLAHLERARGRGRELLDRVGQAREEEVEGGLQLRPLQLRVLLELLLRLADVTLVLEDGGERLGDQLLIERLQVEQRERARPVERLADARGLLQIELADAVHDRDHVRRQAFGDPRDLEADDLELLRPLREVDEEMQAAALERV